MQRSRWVGGSDRFDGALACLRGRRWGLCPGWGSCPDDRRGRRERSTPVPGPVRVRAASPAVEAVSVRPVCVRTPFESARGGHQDDADDENRQAAANQASDRTGPKSDCRRRCAASGFVPGRRNVRAKRTLNTPRTPWKRCVHDTPTFPGQHRRSASPTCPNDSGLQCSGQSYGPVPSGFSYACSPSWQPLTSRLPKRAIPGPQDHTVLHTTQTLGRALASALVSTGEAAAQLSKRRHPHAGGSGRIRAA